jgi:hypothetical protein
MLVFSNLLENFVNLIGKKYSKVMILVLKRNGNISLFEYKYLLIIGSESIKRIFNTRVRSCKINFIHQVCPEHLIIIEDAIGWKFVRSWKENW